MKKKKLSKSDIIISKKQLSWRKYNMLARMRLAKIKGSVYV